MNTKWKVILSVMLLITSICTVFTMLVVKLNDEKLETLIEGKAESASIMAETLLTDFSNVYRDRIKTFTNPRVSPSRERMVRAFAERDREKLQQMSKPILKVFKKNPYFSTIGWLLPDNRVFLRIHAPELFGDEVSKIRPDIAAANRDQIQTYGFDAGVSDMQYRIVQPVFYKSKFIGSVQFGINAAFIFDTMEDKLDTHAGMVVLTRESGTLLKSKMPKLVCGPYTIRAKDAELYRPIQNQLNWNLDRQRMTLHGETHTILKILPIHNYREENLGSFFVALQISEELAQQRQLFFTILLISGIILLISFFILYVSYGTLVEKIIKLNQSLERSNLQLEDRVQERTAKLQESEKRLQSILDHAPLGILIADTRTKKFLYANPMICSMLGFNKRELQEMALESIHSREDFNHVKKEFTEQAQNIKNVATDIPFLRKNGTTFEADVFSAPLQLEGRSCLIGFIMDRTESKRMGAQLRRSQKMEAIGLMAGGVAHDLNNILAATISYPELLLMQLPESSELRTPVKAIHNSGKRAASVVADLLTIARGAAITKEQHSLNTLIQRFQDSPECRRLKSTYSKVVYEQKLTAKYSIIDCSSIHIQKSLMNLFTNAVEAVNEGGIIRISTRNQTIDSVEESKHNLEPGCYVILSVYDSGPGITDEDLEHIFEPFYTKKMMGKSGTGLGLAIVWNTVQDHNGTIFVESGENGTDFQLYFPVSKEVSIKRPDSSKETVPKGKGESVLVVDDDPLLRDIATKILTTLNYKVESVSSGEQAIQLLKDTQVDLLVIDMLMEPGINGYQTYKKILAMHPGQKAVIASGFSKSDDVKNTLELGASDFITKPYSFDQLGMAVHNALQNK